MQQYLDLLRLVKETGARKPNRTGVDTLGIFGAQLRFDLQAGFPLVTTKKIFWKGVVEELFWFIRGETSIKPLLDKGVSIWTDWPLKRYREYIKIPVTRQEFEQKILTDRAFANDWGDLGPVYGSQWRRWEAPAKDVEGSRMTVYPLYEEREIDQLRNVVERIKTHPDCRRLIVTAWNPADIDKMALPPCHCFFQFYVESGRLSCQLYQRSADMFLGVPFNIASYALLTHLVAYATGLEVGTFVHTFGDCHIYVNHLDQVDEQLGRTPRPLPGLVIRADAPRDLFGIEAEHVQLCDYDPHPAIRGEVAV